MATIHTTWLTSLVSVQQGQAIGVPGATAAPAASAAPATTSTTGATGQPLPAQPTGSANPFGMMLPMLVVFALIIGWQIWQGRKQGKVREEMLKSVKRGDKVATTGGLIGQVCELTNDEMVLQVEQGKIRFSRSALAGVVRSGKELPDSKVEVKESTVSV